MVSVLSDETHSKILHEFFLEHDLESKLYISNFSNHRPLIDFLRVDYSDSRYLNESNRSQPNFTPSREKIFEDSSKIFDGESTLVEFITTITTKQDRNPNSGVLLYNNKNDIKAPYRNLTPRECFLLMGFDEADFEALIDCNFNVNAARKFFSDSKLIKMAGNSIVVDVLEAIFKQIFLINNMLVEYELKRSCKIGDIISKVV